MRGMLPSYLLVGGGLLAGLYVGVFIVDYEPQVVAWLFSAGAGLSAGAFVAALVTNTPLAGSADQPTHRGVISRPSEEFEPREEFVGDVEDIQDVRDAENARTAPPSRNGNGAGPGH